MEKTPYKPLDETIPPKISRKAFEACMQECSDKSRVELDMMLNILKAKGNRMGQAGALELLARLVQLGLIGPGPVHEEWLRKRVRIV